MTYFERKEANRLHWLVKGHLINPKASDEEIQSTYNSYLKRLWGNNERAVYGESGFEAAWGQRQIQISQGLI